MASPIYPLEEIALDSTGDLIATSLAGRVLAIQSAVAGGHVPLFTGTVYFVDAAQPDDTEDGLTPETAKETITAAIGVASAGDAITVKNGTYAENVAMNLVGLELWGEIGAIIVGTVTMSVASCRLLQFIVVPGAGNAIDLTGNGCKIEDVQATAGVIGFNIDGPQNIITNCIASGYSASGYDIASYNNQLRDCLAQGVLATTRGFYLSNAAADRCSLERCVSIANDVAGYHLIAGVEAVSVSGCFSGGGDGRRIDAGTLNTWGNFAPPQHDALFTGNVWYVSPTGSNTASGHAPDEAFLTITAAIAAAAAGDAITVKAGTYDEAGLDMNLAGLELWCEVGVFIVDTTPGTCLVVSGTACKVRGAHFVQAGAVGLQITGIGNIIEDCVSVNCTVGFDINQHSTQLFNCVGAGNTVTQFDIGERNTVLRNCYAAGTGAATRGFYLSAAADTRCLLDRCDSVGNATAGFEAVASTSYNTMVFCTSGGGDGDTVDSGSFNNWPGYVDTLSTEHHEKIYPLSDGQGTAGAPITIDNTTTDGAGGTREDQDYWGDVVRIIPPGTIAAAWKSLGLYIFATTAADIQQWEIFFTVPSISSTQNGGNDWDENEVDLTVADATDFLNGDYVWVTGADRVEGEIMIVDGAPAGAVVTVARETTADAEAGLRYDYDATAVGNTIYLVNRPTVEAYHATEGSFSASGARDASRYSWHEPRQLSANAAMLMRMLNGTDGGASAFDVTAIYED